MSTRPEQIDDADDARLAWLLTSTYSAPEMRGEFASALAAKLDAEFAAGDSTPRLEQALAENHKARYMLGFANSAEKVHAGLFSQALAALEAGADLSKMDVYLCPVCGDIEFGSPPDKCPICGAPASKFQKIG